MPSSGPACAAASAGTISLIAPTTRDATGSHSDDQTGSVRSTHSTRDQASVAGDPGRQRGRPGPATGRPAGPPRRPATAPPGSASRWAAGQRGHRHLPGQVPVDRAALRGQQLLQRGEQRHLAGQVVRDAAGSAGQAAEAGPSRPPRSGSSGRTPATATRPWPGSSSSGAARTRTGRRSPAASLHCHAAHGSPDEREEDGRARPGTPSANRRWSRGGGHRGRLRGRRRGAGPAGPLAPARPGGRRRHRGGAARRASGGADAVLVRGRRARPAARPARSPGSRAVAHLAVDLAPDADRAGQRRRNTRAAQTVLTAAFAAGVRRVVVVSSALAYGAYAGQPGPAATTTRRCARSRRPAWSATCWRSSGSRPASRRSHRGLR